MDNELACTVFGLLGNQLVMGPSGGVDVNLLAVTAVLDEMGITKQPRRLRTLEKVLTLGRYVLAEVRKESSPSEKEATDGD